MKEIFLIKKKQRIPYRFLQSYREHIPVIILYSQSSPVRLESF